MSEFKKVFFVYEQMIVNPDGMNAEILQKIQTFLRIVQFIFIEYRQSSFFIVSIRIKNGVNWLLYGFVLKGVDVGYWSTDTAVGWKFYP